jgi:alcohol dehydrogenase class IV
VVKGFRPDWVAALGGGAAIDLGKALAALIPAPDGPMEHLEVVGKGLPLKVPPLPFIAIPTTAGTGAEVTRNAVIGLPDHGRKVSLRDERMVARVAIVDPALTDGCPRGVTLASGLDAVTQVIEPFVSVKATPYTDALARPAIATGMAALMRLMQGEDPEARDRLAWVSLCGGLALSNGGLGAVHGFAGVIGGMTGAMGRSAARCWGRCWLRTLRRRQAMRTCGWSRCARFWPGCWAVLRMRRQPACRTGRKGRGYRGWQHLGSRRKCMPRSSQPRCRRRR